MTPQERQLVDELFDKLARLERNPRDRDAERAIDDGLQRAPNAVYALVQTVLVQDEALKRADARIRELSGEDTGAPQEGGGFLDTMRAALGGGTSRGSVPSVRAGGPDTRWNTGGAYAQQQPPQAQAAPQAQPQVGSGGSFLGTAAASAAGVIGGALLMNSISSMFGHRGGGQAFAGEQQASSPWSDSASNSDLSRDAGLNDIGNGGRGGGNDRSAGLFGSDNDDNNDDGGYDVADSGDFGGGDGGGDSA